MGDLQKTDCYGLNSERKKVLTSSPGPLTCLLINLSAFGSMNIHFLSEKSILLYFSSPRGVTTLGCKFHSQAGLATWSPISFKTLERNFQLNSKYHGKSRYSRKIWGTTNNYEEAQWNNLHQLSNNTQHLEFLHPLVQNTKKVEGIPGNTSKYRQIQRNFEQPSFMIIQYKEFELPSVS